MKLTFVEQPEFSRVRDDLFGTETQSHSFRLFQNALMISPRAGDVIPGTNGARKVRWTRAERSGGKSGGIRVIYHYSEAQSRITLLRAYAKNTQEDLTHKQITEIAAEINDLKREG